jgi:7-cyano-7-deazaguanine synthase
LTGSPGQKAIVLLSGGIDSTTALAVAGTAGYDLYSLTFAYGQRHNCEIEAAEKVARAFAVKEHLVLNIDLGRIGGSALTDRLAVPKSRSEQELAGGIPITYVPARNTIFLAFALAWAEVLPAPNIFLGVNAVDYSGYPDCRPEYIGAFEKLANLATKAGVEGEMSFRIHTPLINMTKGEIIRKGLELGIDYSLTHSCYDPSVLGEACGTCDSCLWRKKGFREAGVPDPTKYASNR